MKRFLETIVLLLLCAMPAHGQRTVKADSATIARIAALVDEADSLYRQDLYEEAIALASKADTLASFNWAIRQRENAWALLAMAYAKMGNDQKSTFYAARCCARAHDEKSIEKLSDAMYSMAEQYCRVGEFESAVRYAESSCNLEMMMDRIDVISDREGFTSRILIQTGDIQSARLYAEDAYEWSTLSNDSRLVAKRMEDLAEVKLADGQYPESDTLFRRALAILSNYESSSINIINCLGHVARAEKCLGNMPLAKEYMQKAVDAAVVNGTYGIIRQNYLEFADLVEDESEQKADSLRALAHGLRYDIYKEDCIDRLGLMTVDAMRREHEAIIKMKTQRNRNAWAIAVLAMLLAIACTILAVSFGLFSHRQAALNLKLKDEVYLRDRFMSIITHDLKAPAVARQTALHMLSTYRDNLSREEFDHLCVEMCRQADTEVDLLENTLLWARIQSANAGELVTMRFGMHSVMQEIMRHYSQMLNAKNLTCSIAPGDEVFVNSNLNMVKTIIRNLLSNAIKFTGKGGLIEMSAEYLPGGSDCVKGVVFRIHDNGIGMSPELASKVLSSRVNVPTRGTDGERGSGIGLKAAADLAVYLEAKMSVDSDPGKGTTFTVEIPNITDKKIAPLAFQQ